jgi:hypothetical protein
MPQHLTFNDCATGGFSRRSQLHAVSRFAHRRLFQELNYRVNWSIPRLLCERGCVIVSDVDSYVINRKLLDSIFNTLLLIVREWEIQIYLQRTFLPLGCLHKGWRCLVHRVRGLYNYNNQRANFTFRHFCNKAKLFVIQHNQVSNAIKAPV